MLAADVWKEPCCLGPVSSGAEGAWLGCVRVAARVMRSNVTDPRSGGSSGRGGSWRETTVVARPGLLISLSRGWIVDAALFVSLTLALVLSMRVAGASPLFCLVVLLFDREGLSSRRCRAMRACQRRHAVPSSLCAPRLGFNILWALRKRCPHCLNECVSSWQFTQWPRLSLSAAERSVDESRSLQKGGSSVSMDMQTTLSST